MSKVVESYWFTSFTICPPSNNIGIVKVYDDTTKLFKYYIGCGRWGDQNADENYIKDFGAPLHPELLADFMR